MTTTDETFDGFKVAMFADTHLGYSARCRTHAATGLNERVKDGYLALRDTITGIIDAEVDLVVHGGDLFHRSWPTVSDIVWARRQFDRLAVAGIPVVGNTGNHDASSERGKAPATSAVHDPDRRIDMITDPYVAVEPVEGLLIHMVSHYGLAQEERLVPDPVDGKVNILSAHGAAMIPGHEIFHCVDSPGEQPIGLDLLANPGFAVTMLGHYHGMGEVMDGVWYAGSAIRRGFSDPAGGRGWLLFTIAPDGRVRVEQKHIAQRPQFDLPRIDAAGLTGSQVEEMVRGHLADLGEQTRDAIIRQVVTNASTSVRQGIDLPGLASLVSESLMWMPDFRRPEATDAAGERTVDGAGASLRTAGAADLPRMFTGWFSGWAEDAALPEPLREPVAERATQFLTEASEGVEGGDFAAPAATPGTSAADDPDGAADTDTGGPLPLDRDGTHRGYGITAPTGTAAPLRDATTGQEVPW